MRVPGHLRHPVGHIPAQQHATLRLRRGATREKTFPLRFRLVPAFARAARLTPDPPLSPSLAFSQGDDRCSERTCYATPSEHCWKKEEQRAAAACKPPVAEGPAVGFVHIFGAAPDYVQNMEAINNQYNIEGLPIKIKDRVKTAVRAFDSYTERRPIVVVVDVAYWWAGSHMGWWKKWDADLGSRKKFAAKLDEYTEDMDQLVRLVDKEMKKTGRPYALVGKSNHNRGFRKGTVNFKFMVEMGEAVKRVFEKHGHHFYDWRGVADDADKKNEWTMVDKLHQTSESNALQTAAFMKWTRHELGKEFAVNLDAQEKALAKAEEARRLEREEDAAEARRTKREEKKKAEAAAQKAKDEAEWEAAEEERRQREAAEAAAKEAEDQEKLEQAQQEAMSTLNNIRGYLRGSIANILEPKEGAGALGARRPSSAAAAMAEAD